MRTVGGEREREKGRYIKRCNWKKLGEREREGEKEKSESERERRKASKQERKKEWRGKGKKLARERERERDWVQNIYIFCITFVLLIF